MKNTKKFLTVILSAITSASCIAGNVSFASEITRPWGVGNIE